MLPFSEACERNKEPILEVLRTAYADRRHVLEIGSGTGQHAVYFAARLPHLTWQPTERLQAVEALAARVAAEGSVNVHAPLHLDVAQAIWPVLSADAAFTANTLHIMSWHDVMGLFEGLARALTPGAVIGVYGPFNYSGRYTAPSNLTFDQMLRARDSLSGIRDLDDLRPLAASLGFHLTQDHDLPANNRLLVFVKEPMKKAAGR